jgi:putative inorganic carbon (hco3(-)) transporter
MGKQFNLENLIYFTIFILPAYLMRFSFFGMPTNILEVAILFVFILWIFQKGYINIYLEPYKKYIIPLAFIAIGLILSVLVNKNYAAGLGIIKGWFFFPILFVFLASQIIKKEKLINVFLALYLSAFFVSVVAIFYLILGALTYDGRLQAFFNSPNYLAMYLAPALIVLQVKSLKFPPKADQPLAEKIIFLISGIIILATFYFTYSYAAWISVALSLIVVTIFKNKKVIKNKTTVILLLMIILLFSVQANSEKSLNLINYNRSSLDSRMMIWRSAGKMLKENWVFGIGPGSFQNKYLEYQKYYPLYLEWAVPHPHNLYLAFWLYGGILSFAGFLWFLVLWFKDALKRDDSVIKYISLGIMLYILIHGLADTTYFKNDLAILFWSSLLMLKM